MKKIAESQKRSQVCKMQFINNFGQLITGQNIVLISC